VAFLGNHDVGIAALAAIAESEEVAAVVTHPPDPEDGAHYASLHDFARARAWPLLRGTGRDTAVAAFLRQARPDLLWITDYRYLLPAELLALAPLGAINLHPSLLPRYRGRAPLNWAILEGECELGLTAHYVDAGMDSGDILIQERFPLAGDEDVGDALAKLLPLYRAMTRSVLESLRAGQTKRTPQDASRATVYPARRPENGRIDWSQSAVRVRNLIRAVTAPYPGAFTDLGASKVIVWKARLADGDYLGQPGEIVALRDAEPVVRCGEGALHLIRIEHAGPPAKVGERFGETTQ
jgi:methionyl-tRNA formyltransferase